LFVFFVVFFPSKIDYLVLDDEPQACTDTNRSRMYSGMCEIPPRKYLYTCQWDMLPIGAWYRKVEIRHIQLRLFCMIQIL
jgi:hypothetical protein